MTTTSRLLLLVVIPLLVVTLMLLPKARAQHPNSTTWDLLLPLADTISSNHAPSICRTDGVRHMLWDVYRTTSRNSESLPMIVKDLNEELTQWRYINSRINMIGLFLFGPDKYKSILTSTARDPEQAIADDLQCFSSTLHMFSEHCGCLHKHCLARVTAFGNMCNHATDKAAIKDALAFACGMDIINPLSKLLQPAVNVKRRPSIRVEPAPIRGSSEYCERVAVEGVSRMKFGSFSKKYHVLLRRSGLERLTRIGEQVQVCVHRDASLGLCECEKDDWRSLKNPEWSFVMSPYEKLYVDVKLSPGTHRHVSVYLKEVSQEWRYMLLAVGFSLLFLAPVASKRLASYCSNSTGIWLVRVIAVAFIFQGSFDTLYAVISVVLCLALYLQIMSIYHSVTSNKPPGNQKKKSKKLKSSEQVRGQETTEARDADTTTVKGNSELVKQKETGNWLKQAVKACRSFLASV